MILSKTVEKFTKEFDFTEGIVSEAKWDSNLMDLLISIHYFWDEHKNRNLIVRLKNCIEAEFSMPKVYEKIPENELKNYTYSWYTITSYDAQENNGSIKIGIKTIDYDSNWLTATCKEIWVENED